MKRTLNQSQLENMIAECVGQVISESRQPRQQKHTRKVMNEAQLNRYIQGIINEEMENEALRDYARGAGNYIGNFFKKKANDAGNAIGNAATSAGNAIGNAAKGVQQFGKQAMQAGKNASAAADAEKLANSVQMMYNKYSATANFTKWQNTCITNAIKALNQLSDSFKGGNIEA